MGITNEVSSIIQSSKEQFERAMTTSLTVDVLKNFVLRSVPTENNETEKINNPKFRESFNRILNPITANIIDRFQSVGQFDTGNLFTSMVTSIADSVSLESSFRTDSLESKFLLNKIPLDKDKEWIQEVNRAYESLRFSNEDIKKRFSQNLKYIFSFEAGKKVIDDIKDEVKQSIDETEAKNELVEGTLQEIADYKKEVAPPDDEYVDAENPDDQAAANGEELGEEGTGEEENLEGEAAGEDAAGEEGLGEGAAGDEAPLGEGDDPLEGEGDISSGEGDIDLNDGGDPNLEGSFEDESNLNTDELTPESDPTVETDGKKANVIININASGESTDPVLSTEAKSPSKEAIAIYSAIYKTLGDIKKNEKTIADKIKNLPYVVSCKPSLFTQFGLVGASLSDFIHKHGKITYPGYDLKIDFSKYEGDEEEIGDKFKQDITRDISSFFIHKYFELTILTHNFSEKSVRISFRIKQDIKLPQANKDRNGESFTSKMLKEAKAHLPLHTAESFAKAYVPLDERDFNDMSLPDVKIMASEATNAMGNAKKEIDIRLLGAKYLIEKSDKLSKEDKITLAEKLNKLSSISNEALYLANIWGNSMEKLNITQNGLLNSNESTLFIARNIISRFLTNTKSPTPIPLPYTSKENFLTNAFDILQLRQELTAQENPPRPAIDDLISRENVFYHNVAKIDDNETKEKATAVIDLTDMVFKKALTANFITDWKIKSWEQNVGKDQKDTNTEVKARVEDKFEKLWQRPLNTDEKAIVSATTNNDDVTEIIPTPYEKFLIKLTKESTFDKSIENGKPVSPLTPEEKEANRFKAKIFTTMLKSLEKFNLVDKYDFMEIDKFCNSTNFNLLHIDSNATDNNSSSEK
jgi:hypothetical protein